MTEFIEPLSPFQNYTIWIETHSNNSDNYTISKYLSVRTYSLPHDINFVSSTANEIVVSWKSSNDIALKS